MNAFVTSLISLIAATTVAAIAVPTRIEPHAPAAAPAPKDFLAERSTISVDLVLPLETIRAKLEGVIPQNFPFDTTGDAHVYGRPSRGPISVRIDGGRVVATMGVGGRVQVEKKVLVLNVSVGVDVSGTITASIQPKLNGWEIEPHLTIATKLNNAVAKTAIGDIGVTGLVEGEVGKLAGQIQPQAEAALAQALRFQPKAVELWNKINDSYAVGAAPRTWLRFTPRAARALQFSISGDAVSTRLGLECDLQVFVQEEKPPRIESPLSPLEIVSDAKAMGDTVKLALPIVVPYDGLNREATQALAKGPISLPEVQASVSVSDVKFAPHGDGLLLAVEFSGKHGTFGGASGTLYFLGRPHFDVATQEFRVADLQYEVETEKLLLKTADWFLHSQFRERLEAGAVVKLGGELARAKDNANRALDDLKRQLPGDVRLDARVDEVRLEQDALRLFRDAVVGVFYVDGRMSVSLGP